MKEKKILQMEDQTSFQKEIHVIETFNLLVKSYLYSSLFFGSQYFSGEQCESRVFCLYLIQILTDPVVTDVSKKLQKSVSQVLLRWAVQEGIGKFARTCKRKSVYSKE